MNKLDQTIAVAYLARGADKSWDTSCERFVKSYKRHCAGVEHSLYVIFKGFANASDLAKAEAIFSGVDYKSVMLADDSFDIGAYIEWANSIDQDRICVFNTASEILAADWLRKLAVNLDLPSVELVGATGSFESLNDLNGTFPLFPNIHIRSTAFMVNRRDFCNATKGLKIEDKVDAFQFESGTESLTRQVLRKGKEALLVGRNGRGYSPKFWSVSDTFRQGVQENLLVADNVTRNFLALPWAEKREVVVRTWGKYIRDDQRFLAVRD